MREKNKSTTPSLAFHFALNINKTSSFSEKTDMPFLWKLNPSDRKIAVTKLLIKPANLHTKETEIGA